MASVGIRQLRDNVSALVKRVAAGETIDVTDHGHPVARLVPVRSTSPLAQMLADGRALPAEVDLLDYEIEPRQPGEPLLSQALNDLRRDER